MMSQFRVLVVSVLVVSVLAVWVLDLCWNLKEEHGLVKVDLEHF